MNSEEWEDVNMRAEALRRRVVTEREAVSQSPEKSVVIDLVEAQHSERPLAKLSEKPLAELTEGELSEELQADLTEEEDMWDLFAPRRKTAWRTTKAQDIPAEEWRRMDMERAMVWKKWNEEDVKANQERWLNRYEIQASEFHDEWMAQWSRYGSFEDATEIKSMRYTDEPAPRYAVPCDTLQVFSVKVAGIRGGLQWPLDVFGLVAVRDCHDQKRNIIFHRKRADSQTLTEEDPYLVLTGPTRAVLALLPVTIEVNLKVKGSTISEDKEFSSLAVPLESGGSRYPRLLDWDYTSKLSTLLFTVGHIIKSVEATIFVQVVDGSWPDGSRCKFAARATSSSHLDTALIDNEEIILLDSRGEKLPDHGDVNLSRCVASVEVTGKLIVSVTAWLPNSIIVGKECSAPKEAEGSYWLKDEVNTPTQADSVVAKQVIFTPKEADKSDDILDLGFCNMKVTVAWSLILNRELRFCY